MAKKQYIATILLLVFFTCTACTNKDAVVKSLYPLNYTSKLSLTTLKLNTDSIVHYFYNSIAISENKLFSKTGLLNRENRMNLINGGLIFHDNTTNRFDLILTYPRSPLCSKKF